MKEHHRGKRFSRRQFLSKGLWTGIIGLFAGTIFGLHGQSEKAGPKPGNLTPREARFYSKLAG